MSTSVAHQLSTLSAAEEFFSFLGVDYSPQVVQISRLHILKRFSQYLANQPIESSLPEADQRHRYADLLRRAYQDFIESTPRQERVFKVFDHAPGVKTIPLAQVRATLAQPRR